MMDAIESTGDSVESYDIVKGAGNFTCYHSRLVRLFHELDFPSKIWFEKIPKKIEDRIQRILDCRKYKDLPEKDVKDALCALFVTYLHEIWIGEIPPTDVDLDTTAITEHLFENDTYEGFCEVTGLETSDRNGQQIWNLRKAAFLLFGCSFQSVEKHLSMELVKRVNAMIGHNIFDCPGEFRTKSVRASGSTVTYCLPSKISERLQILIDFVKHRKDEIKRGASQDEVTKLKHMILLGALFFSEFLLIHPFIDGNGRTARLLLNLLLFEDVIVPFSLYYRDRKLYIEVLEERNEHAPEALAAYLLCCIEKTAHSFNYLVQ